MNRVITGWLDLSRGTESRDQRDGGSDFGASTSVLRGKRAEKMGLTALGSLNDVILDLQLANRGRVHQRDCLGFLGKKYTAVKIYLIIKSKGFTYGRNHVGNGGDGRLAVNAVAALIGDLGLGHLDRLASTFDSVLGGAATDHITLLKPNRWK